MEKIIDIEYEDLEKQWFPMLYKFAQRYVPGFEQEDKLQELRIVLWKCQKKFDPRRGSFKTLLYCACSNRIWQLNKVARAIKRHSEEPNKSLDELLNYIASEKVEVLEGITRLSPEAQIAYWGIFENIFQKDWGLNRKQTKAAKEELREFLKVKNVV